MTGTGPDRTILLAPAREDLPMCNLPETPGQDGQGDHERNHIQEICVEERPILRNGVRDHIGRRRYGDDRGHLGTGCMGKAQNQQKRQKTKTKTSKNPFHG